MELTDNIQFPDSVHGLDISLLTTSKTILWSSQSPFQKISEALSPSLKMSGVYSSLLFYPVMWLCLTSIPPIHFHGKVLM